ncbi:hypothetical protein ACTFIW_004399 [Dictyostelium discoideum]
MIKTYNTNVLKFLLKKHLKIKLTKLSGYYIWTFSSKVIKLIKTILLYNESLPKWKEITSKLIDDDMIVTIKETIDWLLDIETGSCFQQNYSRIKYKQIVSILDLNKENSVTKDPNYFNNCLGINPIVRCVDILNECIVECSRATITL